MNQCQQPPLSIFLTYKGPQRTQSSSKSPSGSLRPKKETHPFSYQSQHSVFSTPQTQQNQISAVHTQSPQYQYQVSKRTSDFVDPNRPELKSPSLSPFDVISPNTASQYGQPQFSIPNKNSQRTPIPIKEIDLETQLNLALRDIQSTKSEYDNLKKKYTELSLAYDETTKQLNEISLKKPLRFDSSFSSIGDNRTENMLLEENEQIRTCLLEAQQTILELRVTIDSLQKEGQVCKTENYQLQLQNNKHNSQLMELEFENSQLLLMLKKQKPSDTYERSAQTEPQSSGISANEEMAKTLQNSIFLKNKLIDEMVVKQGEMENHYISMAKSKDREILQLKSIIIEKEEELENLQIKFVETSTNKRTLANYK